MSTYPIGSIFKCTKLIIERVNWLNFNFRTLYSPISKSDSLHEMSHLSQWILILGSLHRILVIIVIGPHIVIDAFEGLLTQWTFRFHFGPLHQTHKTECVKTAVCEWSIFQFAQAYGTVRLWRGSTWLFWRRGCTSRRQVFSFFCRCRLSFVFVSIISRGGGSFCCFWSFGNRFYVDASFTTAMLSFWPTIHAWKMTMSR